MGDDTRSTPAGGQAGVAAAAREAAESLAGVASGWVGLIEAEARSAAARVVVAAALALAAAFALAGTWTLGCLAVALGLMRALELQPAVAILVVSAASGALAAVAGLSCFCLLRGPWFSASRRRLTGGDDADGGSREAGAHAV